MIAATLPAPLAAFSINLALPVTGPFYDIDASQSQTVSDLTMTLLRVWVSPSTVRVVFCPDPSLDREVWTFELIGEFGGEEVHPDYRGDYRHSSDDCTLYDYVRPRGASIQPMTFRMDRLRSVVGPLTQAQIDEANTRLADQGVEIALTEGGPTLVQVPEGMERMDAWKIVFEVLSESIPGPWVFSVDVPQE